jgi:hypothetical protein
MDNAWNSRLQRGTVADVPSNYGRIWSTPKNRPVLPHSHRERCFYRWWK